MRLLVYSQDSMGLGHLRRTRNVAEELLARAPDSSILVLADSPAAPFFAQLPGIDHVKLPTIVKTGLAGWRTATLPLDICEVVDLRAKLILSAYRAFRPDAVLVDHMPTGALGELKLTLDHATTGPARTRLFLGLRDILNAPEEIRRAWGRSGDYEYLQRYDQVLIYGCREIFDAESAYRLELSAQQVTYCHYVAPRPLASLPPDIPTEPYILVMGGGGGDAAALQKTFLEAFPEVFRNTQLPAVVLTGPNMPVREREALSNQAAGQGIQVWASVDDATAWLPRAAAVVTMAGYNSLAEVLFWRKKALVIPRRGPSAEQRMRAHLFAQRHLVRMLDPDQLSPWRLAEELLGLLAEDGVPDPASIPPLDGAQRAAALLLEHLAPVPLARPSTEAEAPIDGAAAIPGRQTAGS